MKTAARSSRWTAALLVGLAGALALGACGRDFSFRPEFEGGAPDVRDAGSVDVPMLDTGGNRTDAGDAGSVTDVIDVVMPPTDTGPGNDACTMTCNGACVDLQTDPNHCGSCMRICSAPASGSTQCVNGVCVATCNPGYHLCSASLCAADDNANRCGATCMSCPRPTNGTATCVSGTCGITCDAGFHTCGDGACYADTDAQHCGSACTACAGGATCVSGACTQPCPAGSYPSGASCLEPDGCADGPAVIDLQAGVTVTIMSTFLNATSDNSSITCPSSSMLGAGPDRVYEVNVPAGLTFTAVEVAPSSDFSPRVYATTTCGTTVAVACASGTTTTPAVMTIPSTTVPATYWVWADSSLSASSGSPFRLTLYAN